MPFYAAVFDGRGGYALTHVRLIVGAAGVSFSGRATDDTTNDPVASATVSVNGKTTTTNPTGAFFITVPEDPTARYVLNIKAPGYALLSQIYDNQNLGGTYTLIRAQAVAVDPATIIDIVDRRGVLEKQQLRGGRVIIDPGTLDATGPLTGLVMTWDPSERQIPGDYRAKDASGADASLITFGALFVEFRDGAGNTVNLRSGASATVMIPIVPGQLATAPATIPLWAYDEQSGFWREEGTAARQDTPTGPMYVGKTSHFSTLNTDVAQGGAATCLRMQLDSSLPAGVTLRVHIPTAPTYKQVRELTLNSDQFHALYRLPKNDTITLEVLDTNHNLIPGTNQTIDLSARPPMTGTNLWPPFPYTECGVPVVLSITIPAYGQASPGHPYFLTGPFGNFNVPAIRCWSLVSQLPG